MMLTMTLIRRMALPLLVAVSFALLLLAAGCSSDSGGSSGTDANARSDTELTTLADQAAADSGINSFKPITASNAAEVGQAAADAVNTSGQDAQPSFTLFASPGAAPGDAAARALENALNTAGRAGGWLRRTGVGFNAATQSQTVDETVKCPSSGTAAVTGTVTVTSPDDPEAPSGTITVTIQNMILAFKKCSDGSYTLWGEMRFNSNDSLAYTISEATNEFSLDVTYDEYLDAGLVLQEVATKDAYNLSLRSTLAGTLALLNPDNVNLAATLTIVDNATGLGFTCTATVTSAAEAFDPTWVCTAA